MIAPPRIIHDPPCLLADVRELLSTRPALVDHHARLAALLVVEEHEVWIVLEVLSVDGEVLS